MAQHRAQGDGCSDVDLGELGGGHLALGALTEVDGAQRQRQSPQAAALRQLSCGGTDTDTERRCSAHSLHTEAQLTCELQLAQPVVNQRRVLGAGPGLVPLVLPSHLVDQPAQRSWAMQTVANQIPGQRAEQVQFGGGQSSGQDGQAGLQTVQCCGVISLQEGNQEDKV